MSPESIGLEKSSLILGKHSGRAAFKDKLINLGYDLGSNALEDAFAKFKDLADRKKEIVDEDIIALIDSESINNKAKYQLSTFSINSNKECSEVNLTINVDNKEVVTKAVSSNGPVDAIFKAIQSLIPHDSTLELYQINAVTGGTDSQATATVRLKNKNKTTTCSVSNSNVLLASALSYINCLNTIFKNNV